MRMVLQRVSRAEVAVEGRVTGSIGRGLLVFLGVEAGDGPGDLDWLAAKLPALRLFEDDAGKLNRSLVDIGGGVLLISQFTLFGNARKGTRPSFNRAAPPEEAERLYSALQAALSQRLGHAVPTGVFGAHMSITAVNDGPVTLLLDSRNRAL